MREKSLNAPIPDGTGDTLSLNKRLHRKYPRAHFHDYNGGLYFVTVCTKNKTHFFGEICNDEMHLSVVGRVLFSQLQNAESHYNDVEIPLFIVMPNHFHAIISIGTQSCDTETGLSKNLGRLNQLARLTVATSGDPTLSTHHSCRLGNIVSAIKSGVTRFARCHNIDFQWQPRYHDHIIRNNGEMNQIANYIETNVNRWETDCFNNSVM